MTTPLPRAGDEPETEALPTPQRALAIGAHPDDIEFGCGATLARWAGAGCDITLLVVTDGSKGTWDRSISTVELVSTRKDEQLAAAEALGAAHVVHLDRTDGELVYSMEFRAEMCRQIRLARPDVLLSHDPWRRYEVHPDHRVTGLAVVDGMVAARDHLFFQEQGLAPHRPASMLLFRPDEANHAEDATHTFDTKIAALLCHRSQAETTMGSATEDDERRQAFVSELRRRMAEAGEPYGMELAETFRRITP